MIPATSRQHPIFNKKDLIIIVHLSLTAADKLFFNKNRMLKKKGSELHQACLQDIIYTPA